MSEYYTNNYFSSDIFKCDYHALASAIIKQYQPKSIIEFGCGNGDLSRAFAEKGVYVESIDGYSVPHFEGIDNIKFTKVDLNNKQEAELFLNGIQHKFDLAVSLEVAEHLNPDISSKLIEWMTSIADVVVFSAAVNEQTGDGHINCRPREYWHRLFNTYGFMIGDNIRAKIRDNRNVARWYRHNIIDYYRQNTTLEIEEYKKLVDRLISSDSAASSDYYLTYRKMEYLEQVLNLQPLKFGLQFRNFLKKLLGRPIVKIRL